MEVRYQDDDGDSISITSDVEWRACVRYYQGNGRMVTVAAVSTLASLFAEADDAFGGFA